MKKEERGSEETKRDLVGKKGEEERGEKTKFVLPFCWFAFFLPFFICHSQKRVDLGKLMKY